LGEAARGGAPLRVVVAYRDTEVHPADPLAALLADLARADLAARLPLDALTPAAARELVASLLGGAEDAEDAEAALAVERVTRRAGGTPFFLVSCALALQEGTLGDEERAVGGSDEVPWSVGQHIRQRVAALPTGAQTLLGAAAVAGRVAPSALLLAMVDQPEAEALAALAAACRAGLLVEEGETAYRFAHDLIHEVVEGELGAARRRAWHRRAARALEAAAGEPEAERLVEHHLRGGDREQAVVYLERAGDQARALYAHAAAERHYRRLVEALDALGRSVAAARAREQLGAVLHTMAHYAAEVEALAQATAAYHAASDLEGEARTVLSAAYAAARARAPRETLALLRPLQEEPLASRLSPHAQGLLHCRLGDVHFAEGRLGEALVAHEQALAQVTGADDLLAYAAILGGLTLTALMRLDEAIAIYEAMIPAAERLGNLAMLARALMNSGWCYGLQGRPGLWRETHERAADVVERLGDPALRVLHSINQGDLAYVAGDWGEAAAQYARASAALSRLGPSWAAHELPISLGRLALAQGRVEEGLHSLEEGIGLAQRSGVVDPANQAQRVLAEWDVLEGRPEAACARLEPLLAGAEETYATWALRPVLAWAYLERGEERRAEDLVGQALATAQAAGVRPILTDALCVQALVAARRGRWHEAEAALEEALTCCHAMPHPYAEAKALWIYGQLEAARGDPAAARTRFTQALAICDRLGEGLYRPHIKRALGQAGGHADRARASRGRDGCGA
jgi:tetratricopeptide (TPR) repeat protein